MQALPPSCSKWEVKILNRGSGIQSYIILWAKKMPMHSPPLPCELFGYNRVPKHIPHWITVTSVREMNTNLYLHAANILARLQRGGREIRCHFSHKLENDSLSLPWVNTRRSESRQDASSPFYPTIASQRCGLRTKPWLRVPCLQQ